MAQDRLTDDELATLRGDAEDLQVIYGEILPHQDFSDMVDERGTIRILAARQLRLIYELERERHITTEIQAALARAVDKLGSLPTGWQDDIDRPTGGPLDRLRAKIDADPESRARVDELKAQLTAEIDGPLEDSKPQGDERLTDDDLDPLCDIVAGIIPFDREQDGDLLWRLIEDWRWLRTECEMLARIVRTVASLHLTGRATDDIMYQLVAAVEGEHRLVNEQGETVEHWPEQDLALVLRDLQRASRRADANDLIVEARQTLEDTRARRQREDPGGE